MSCSRISDISDCLTEQDPLHYDAPLASYVVFSLVWGGLLLRELSDMFGLIGIMMILAAGLIALPFGNRDETGHEH